jgi:hypothetical protein
MVWKHGAWLRVSSVLIIGFFSLQPTYSHADNVLNFYPKDAALTVFGSDVETTATPELGYAPATKTKKSEEKDKSLEQPAAAAPAPARVTQTLDDVRAELKTPDDILKKFGDPDAELTIPGREDAPLPFRGMMAALEVDNRELAQKYAKQYVKYLKKVQTKTDKVMAVVNQAMGEEGMAPPNSLDSIENIPDEKDLEQDEGKLRQEVKDAVKERVPQDPFGEVDVYFFFKMDDEGSKLMIPEIDAFYASFKDDSKVRFVALSLDNPSKEDIQEFAETYKIKFPIKSGMTLAKKLNVTGVPTTLIVPHNATSRMVVENGFRRSFYIEEVVSLMKGEK